MYLVDSIYNLIDGLIPKNGLLPKNVINNKDSKTDLQLLDDYICLEDWGQVVVHTSNNKKIYTFDIQDAYQHIKQYYTNSFHIQKQFLLDLSRSSVFYNRKKINNITKLDDYLVYALKDLYVPFITMCTQSIFAIILHNLYSELDKNIYIGELSDKDLYEKTQYLHFKQLSQHIQCHIHKYLRIFKVNDGKDVTQYIIRIHILIDSSNQNITIQIKHI
jgi:hypothetical protein